MSDEKDEPTLSDVSKRLRQFLGGRTSREIAERTGIHPESVRRYLAGMTPSLGFVVAVCREFNLSAEWLLLDRGQMMPGAPSMEGIPFKQLLGELQSRAARLKGQIEAVEALAAELNE